MVRRAVLAVSLLLFPLTLLAQQQIPIVSGSVTIPGASGYYSVILNQNVTGFSIAPFQGPPGSPVKVLFTEDATGGWTATGLASNIFGTLNLSTSANSQTVVSFEYASNTNSWIITSSSNGGGAVTWPLTSPSGATIGSVSGDLELTASGTNQNITLTPSGSGSVILNPNRNVIVQDSSGVQGTLYLKQGSSTNGVLGAMNSSGTILDPGIVFRGSSLIEIESSGSGGNGFVIQGPGPHMKVVQGAGFIPTTTGCGTGVSLASGSADTTGSITIGTSPGSCAITFHYTFTSAPIAPICVDTTAKTVIGCTASTTALTLGTVTAGDVINWWLTGN